MTEEKRIELEDSEVEEMRDQVKERISNYEGNNGKVWSEKDVQAYLYNVQAHYAVLIKDQTLSEEKRAEMMGEFCDALDASQTVGINQMISLLGEDNLNTALEELTKSGAVFD